MKQKLVNSALVIGSIFISLLTLEVGLRAYHDEWGYTNFRFPQSNKFGGYNTYDAELGWVPKPGFVGTTVTILENGIRSNGPEEVGKGTDDPILAVGDSYTFGDQVRDSETWPAQLEKLSGRTVINGGGDGYGVDQTFLRTRRFLSGDQFITVIFSFIPDDICRSQMSVMFATAKPYFDFKGGRLTLENVPVPRPSYLPNKESGVLITLEHSRLMHAVSKRLFPEWWLRAPPEKEEQDRETGIKVVCALLHELEALTKSHRSELIVLAQHGETESASESMAAKSVLSCVSDPATRVIDLAPRLSELRAKSLFTKLLTA